MSAHRAELDESRPKGWEGVQTECALQDLGLLQRWCELWAIAEVRPPTKLTLLRTGTARNPGPGFGLGPSLCLFMEARWHEGGEVVRVYKIVDLTTLRFHRTDVFAAVIDSMLGELAPWKRLERVESVVPPPT